MAPFGWVFGIQLGLRQMQLTNEYTFFHGSPNTSELEQPSKQKKKTRKQLFFANTKSSNTKQAERSSFFFPQDGFLHYPVTTVFGTLNNTDLPQLCETLNQIFSFWSYFRDYFDFNLTNSFCYKSNRSQFN